MDEAQALETLKDVIFVSRVGDDGSAPWVSDDGTVGVDASLNRDHLLALLFFVDKKNGVMDEEKARLILEEAQFLHDGNRHADGPPLIGEDGGMWVEGRIDLEVLQALMFFFQKHQQPKE